MDPNPYETPKHVESEKSVAKPSKPRPGMALLMGLLAIPAAIVAFCTTCTATASVVGDLDPLSLFVGGFFGIVVAGLMFYSAARAAGGKR
jgi:hypothetical protein